MPKNQTAKYSNQSIDRDAMKQKIVQIFSNQKGRLLNYKQVSAQLLSYDKQERKLIASILNELQQEKRIEEVHRGRYRLKPRTGLVTGQVKISRRGFASIITEDVDEEVLVNWKNLNNALHGDIVKVNLYGKRKTEFYEGEVTEILERRKVKFVGIIEANQGYAFLIPDGKFIPFDIFIPPHQLQGAKNGEKAIVSITRWSDHSKSPEGKVLEVLGKPGDNNVEMHAIMVEYDLPYKFPSSINQDAEQISDKISAEEIKSRRDFRKTTTFTIDPDDAKDFDDAISYQKLDNGLFEIGIHIADVTHYVQEDTTINQEAENRATSVYLVDRVVPMLPERLSNFICSLRPNEDKLCYSVVFQMTADAEIKDYWIGRTIINSDQRFTYDEAQKRIEGKGGALSEEILDIHEMANKLRDKRFVRGAFNFERDEIKFKLDEAGKPIGVFTKTMKEANWLVEEFMLLANRKVAEFIGKEQKKHMTFVYRIHDEPNIDRIMGFQSFIKRFGYKIESGNSQKLSASMNKILKKVQGRPEQHVVENLAIRSMAKAEYSTTNIGHYGLAFDYYTHFTSPIRRFPDMMVHRLLTRYLDGKPSAKMDPYELMCKHSSDMEMLATKAERASIKYKQAEFLQDKLGMEFDGLISGVQNFGIFVEIKENACEGLVPMRNLSDDFYVFDEDNYQIIGKRKGKRYQLGDDIRVRITNVDLQRKLVDMEIA
ncbi:MAG: ribonuclease R [Bacteroidales bacterium]|jgi:ribonuclease R|nr:ribonuclease R [Bacteroidales bacterium]